MSNEIKIKISESSIKKLLNSNFDIGVCLFCGGLTQIECSKKGVFCIACGGYV